MTFDEWMVTVAPKHQPSDDSVTLRILRQCWAAAQAAERERCASMREALEELRDRIKSHPEYADLTEEEELEVGGETAELSYLARVADEALGA